MKLVRLGLCVYWKRSDAAAFCLRIRLCVLGKELQISFGCNGQVDWVRRNNDRGHSGALAPRTLHYSL